MAAQSDISMSIYCWTRYARPARLSSDFTFFGT